MRAMVLLSPARVALTSTEPLQFPVPAEAASPGALSLGSGSPVTKDSSMLVNPEAITPSTGTASPGNTRTTEPMATSAALMSTSFPPAPTR